MKGMLTTSKFETEFLEETSILKTHEPHHTIYDNVIVPIKQTANGSLLCPGIEHRSTV